MIPEIESVPNVLFRRVWTAPAVKGFFDVLCGIGGCGHVFGLCLRKLRVSAGPDVVR
jgi:hypothetical protein